MGKRKRRLKQDERRAEILDAAVAVAKDQGFSNITRDAIAARADVVGGLVTHYFGTILNLKRDIMRYAVRTEILSIIAQGVAIGDKHALKASPDLRKRAIESLAQIS